MGTTENPKQITGRWKYVFWAGTLLAAGSGLASATQSPTVPGAIGTVVGALVVILVWHYTLARLTTAKSTDASATQTPN